MSVSVAVLRNHIEYSAWATGRLLDAAQKIAPEGLKRDFGTADHSIVGTLLHIFRSEKIWLARLRVGFPPAPEMRAEEEELPFLLGAWPPLYGEWREWVGTLRDGEDDRVVEYSDLRGNRRAQQVWQILLHVVNHSTHHRGQVSGFLRASGTAPPPLDFITYVREKDGR